MLPVQTFTLDAMSAKVSHPWAVLDGEKYINFESFKRNGDGVKTPVWFARDADTLVFFTNVNSWKVKRLRRNSDCRLAACSVTGKTIKTEWIDGTCRRIEDMAEVKAAHELLSKKYLSLRLSNPIAKLIGKSKQWAHYRIWRREEVEPE